MLQEQLCRIPDLLDSSVKWIDFLPGCSRKDLWHSLDEEVLNCLKADGIAAMRESWPCLPAVLYMDYFRTGNRQRFETPYFRRRVLLIRMLQGYCAGEDTREMLDGIINAAGSLCEELTWVVPAHNWPQSNSLPPAEPDFVDLFAANTASLLALTVHLLKVPLEREVPRLVERIVLECTRRCLTPFMENDRHWWMGFHEVPDHGPLNNWNPWITSNFLHTLFLIPSDRYSYREGTDRAVIILNHYLEILSPDGGCNEGPAYWNHAVGSLFDCLDILHFAAGESVPLFRDEWFRKAVSYLERMHLQDEYYINFADCSGKLDSLPSGLIRRIGAVVNNPGLKALSAGKLIGNAQAAGGKDSRKEAFSSFRLIRDLFFSDSDPGRDKAALKGISPDIKPDSDCFPDLQIGILRSREIGLILVCKGGHNGESHSHNDVGQFILYGDGHPLLIDPGVGDYTRETFNHMRYTIWTMQSGWHNLPRINSCDQEAGAAHHCDTFQMDKDRVSISLAEAYPEEARVETWLREVFFSREDSTVRLTETYHFLQDNNRVCWNFIFLREPQIDRGSLRLDSPDGKLVLSWPADQFYLNMDFQDIPEEDYKMSVWGVKTIWRARIQNIEPLSQKGQTEFIMTYTRKGNQS